MLRSAFGDIEQSRNGRIRAVGEAELRRPRKRIPRIDPKSDAPRGIDLQTHAIDQRWAVLHVQLGGGTVWRFGRIVRRIEKRDSRSDGQERTEFGFPRCEMKDWSDREGVVPHPDAQPVNCRIPERADKKVVKTVIKALLNSDIPGEILCEANAPNSAGSELMLPDTC